ncbi:MAG: gas vesicle protein [Candidatus Nanopelagicales bacterium]
MTDFNPGGGWAGLGSGDYGSSPRNSLEPVNNTTGSLADVVDSILDKGLVINADIMISLAGVELLGIKVRAALASFETAARYGLEFPSGTDLSVPAWQEAAVEKMPCPACSTKFATREELLDTGCPACGWQSARARAALPRPEALPPAT